MFENNVFTDYTGADASGEILIMLLVAFALGYLLRWIMNRLWGCEHCMETELEAEMRRMSMPSAGSQTNETASINAAAIPAGITIDDLKIVEGIGPKIEELLHSAGISTWRELSLAPISRLEEILAAAGDRFRMHNPATWPEQAALAESRKWEELKEYQDFLNGGRADK